MKYKQIYIKYVLYQSLFRKNCPSYIFFYFCDCLLVYSNIYIYWQLDNASYSVIKFEHTPLCILGKRGAILYHSSEMMLCFRNHVLLFFFSFFVSKYQQQGKRTYLRHRTGPVCVPQSFLVAPTLTFTWLFVILANRMHINLYLSVIANIKLK